MNNAVEFEVDGKTFQARKLPAYPDQLLLGKALIPVFTDVLPIITKVASDENALAKLKNQDNMPPEVLAELVEAVITSLGKLSDDNLTSLTRRCLKSVQMKQGEAGWADVMTPQGGLMFPLDLPTIFQLIWKVVEINLLGFLFAARGMSPGAAG